MCAGQQQCCWQGEEVGDIYREGKTYDVNVYSIPEVRNSVSDVEELLIDTPNGGHIRLKDVADVRTVPAPNVIEREGQSRKIDVSANVRGRDLGSVAKDVEAVITNLGFPLGYHAEVLGEFAERQAAQRDILLAGAVAVTGNFLPAVHILWQLAPCHLDLLHAALGLGRRRAGSQTQQWCTQPRFAGRFA